MDTTHWPQGIGVVRAVTMEGSNKQAINNNNGINNNNTNTSNAMQLDQRRSRPPQKDQALNCPRCNSTNTKFCYYNNYSLTQPRYFCKTCRRYWTEGGSLRNVPVGGGSRKNKRSSSSSTSTSSTTSTTSSQPMSLAINKKLLIHDHHNPNISPSLLPPSLSFPLQSASQSPKLIHQGQDLNLAYPPTAHDHHHHDHHHSMTRISFLHHDHLDPYNSGTHNGMANPSTASPTDTTTTTTTCSSSQQVSAMELLKTGMASRGGLSAFMAMPMPMPMTAHANAGAMFSSPPPPTTTGFSNLLGGNVHHEFKPSLSFGLDQYDHQAGGYNNGDNNLHDHGVQENSGTNNSTARLLFPNDHQDLKQVSSNNTTNTTTTDHHDDHDRHGRHQFDQQINRGQGDHNSASGYNWNGMLGGGSW